jgi:hypothetical protein
MHNKWTWCTHMLFLMQMKCACSHIQSTALGFPTHMRTSWPIIRCTQIKHLHLHIHTHTDQKLTLFTHAHLLQAEPSLHLRWILEDAEARRLQAWHLRVECRSVLCLCCAPFRTEVLCCMYAFLVALCHVCQISGAFLVLCGVRTEWCAVRLSCCFVPRVFNSSAYLSDYMHT